MSGEAVVGLVMEEAERLREENARLRQWVSDLQSGCYVNCVYCGHRYGPDDGETPLSMADVLREHVERCPEHPLAQLRVQVENALMHLVGDGDVGAAFDVLDACLGR